MEGIFKTSKLLVPTSSASPTPTPLPTVIPNIPTFEHIEAAGKKTLWIVFILLLLSSITFIVLSWRVPVQKRVFHVTTTLIAVIATISYFATAVGDGNSYAHHIIKESHKHVPNTVEHVFRQVFWARYVNWALTTPLILLNLGFLAGFSGADILVTIVADAGFFLLGLFSAFGTTRSQRWGYFAFAIISHLVIAYQLVISGRRSALAKSDSTAKLYATLGGFVLILWTLYPIFWALGANSRTWSVDTEVIAYAVLDVLAIPVLGFWILFTHGRNVKSIEGFWSHGLSNEGLLRIGDED